MEPDSIPTSGRAALGVDRCTFDGRGVKVILFDSGLALEHPWLCNLGGLGADTEDDHAFRGAWLLHGEGGVSPAASLYSVDYRDLSTGTVCDFIAQSLGAHGRFDITVHPYSAPDRGVKRVQGAADFTRLADADATVRTLAVAAAGHDGPGHLRFPASCPASLAVGVCDADGELSTYCGVDLERRKPEVVVRDRAWSTRDEQGRTRTLDGTSAAANLVGGFAALWCQRLRDDGHEVTPATLRAAVIASAQPRDDRVHRVLDELAAQALQRPCSLRQWPLRVASPRRRVTVHAEEDGRVSVAVVLEHRDPGEHWIPDLPRLRVTMVGSSPLAPAPMQTGWAVFDWDCVAGQTLEFVVEVVGDAAAVSLVAIGARAEVTAERAPITRPNEPIVLGIGASHDASACLVRGGRLEVAIGLERVTRVKHDGQPFLDRREAADYCLRAAGLREADVDLFAFNLQSVLPGYAGLAQPVCAEDYDLFDPWSDRALFVSHHLCHAFGAFFGSDFPAATVVVCDGSGGSTVGAPDLVLRGPQFREYLATELTERPQLHTQSVYRFDPAGYGLVDREYAPSFNVRCGSSSLGETYAAVSHLVFGDWKEGAKLMGLAPYGSADHAGASLLTTDRRGRLQYGQQWKHDHAKSNLRRPVTEYRDLAARVQRDLEVALLQRFSLASEHDDTGNLVYCGGIALNSVANEKLRELVAPRRLYIMPASHDAGISIGAAAAGLHHLTGTTARVPPGHDYLGYAYRDVDYECALEQFESVVQWRRVELEDLAERLDAGQVIGWFQGAAEFGPRALGHRSILADPRKRETWQRINRRIKFREDFRPFAPAVAEEDASRFFELQGALPYMLRVVPVRPEYRETLGAVTHVDGSARVQTVRADVCPEFHALLRAFGRRSGFPILLNTSLNVRGEPIVETPRQAIELMLATHLDALVLGSYLVELSAATPTSMDSRFVLAPKVSVVSERRGGPCRSYLEHGARGNAQVELEPWESSLLMECDGKTPLAALVDRHAPAQTRLDGLVDRLDALRVLRWVIPVATAVDSTVSPRPTTALEGWERWLEVGDNREQEGAQDLRDALARIWPLRRAIGVTRMADVTGYDYVGLPVATASRPAVNDLQITATQGKGATIDHAYVSALYEAAERSAASRGVPLRTASEAELLDAGELVVTQADLGVVCPSPRPLEWLRTERLVDGAGFWIPAAEVLFPCRAAGSPTTIRPCTTGLAAGQTKAAAIVSAILEVLERDAVTRYTQGEPAPLVELDSLQGTPEAEIVAAFAAADVRVAILDLSGLAPVPVFKVVTWSPEGPIAFTLASGQGAGIDARTALRRALYEAAQTRVVCIQGAREDLVRHASDWVAQSTEDAARRFERRVAQARRHGTSTVAAALPPMSTAAKGRVLLSRIGQHVAADAYVTNLTDPEVGIPVVHVSIPGLVDGLSDPGRRRRVA